MNFNVWGLTGSLNTQNEKQLSHATERLWYWIDRFDVSCNRFRPDSEISRLNTRPGEPIEISDVLELAIDAAIYACDVTGGLCDPTVLPALLALGYDRDYDQLRALSRPDVRAPVYAPGVGAIALDRDRHRVTLAPRCQIDLGATAKALLADVVANELAVGGGVALEVGGDVAIRGSGPHGPWVVGVSDSLRVHKGAPRIQLLRGGVATSSTNTRSWWMGERLVNHIVDPRTGDTARGKYATATVAAESCVLANAFATAALLWDDSAAYHIAQAGWAARLVRRDGEVEYVGGWPPDDPSEVDLCSR